MTIETIYSCPLGHKCESVTPDGKIDRCRLFVKLAGQNPQTGEQMDEWNCSFSWTPLLLVENAMTNRGQTAAIESFRNETQQGQAVFNQLVAAMVTNRQGRLDGNSAV